MKKFNKTGQRIADRLQQKNLKIIDLSWYLKLQPNGVYMRLRGNTDWRLREIQAVAKFLGMTADELIND